MLLWLAIQVHSKSGSLQSIDYTVVHCEMTIEMIFTVSFRSLCNMVNKQTQVVGVYETRTKFLQTMRFVE